MKCYINTYYKFNNYGTKLQNYALVKTLEKYNNEVETIYLKTIKDNLKDGAKQIFILMPTIIDKQKKWKNENRKKQIFKEFDKELHYKRIYYHKLINNNFSNSISITGSDQVWSPHHLKRNSEDEKIFFMQYIEKNKRFTYAPSFGVNEIPHMMQDMYRNNLRQINDLSVREEEGAKIIFQLTNKKAEIVPDPVFLLSKQEWSNISNLDLSNKGKYLVTYFLSPIDRKLLENIKEYASKNELKIINISGNNYDKSNEIISPREFVKYIEYSTCIFTDSFHASAFSIIMNKPFQVFERLEVKQASRILNLLKKYECLNNFINKEDLLKNNYLLKPQISNISAQILDKDKNTGLKYIEKILEKGEIANGKSIDYSSDL